LSTAQGVDRDLNVSINANASALSDNFFIADARILHCFTIEKTTQAIVHRNSHLWRIGRIAID
jgi:hypothetical protein